MKGQSHLIKVAEPINWLLAPPIMYGLAGCEVQNPYPVESWSETQLPQLDTTKVCSKCLAYLETQPRYSDPDEHGDSEPLHFYVYAIGNKREREHSGRTIADLENTVSRVGVTKGFL